MNLNPGDSQIHVLLINIDSLSLFLPFPFIVSLANQQKLARRAEFHSRVHADRSMVKFP